MLGKSAQRLIIGSAQFGMRYGVGSGHQMVSEKEVVSILEYAKSCGISYIDTAAAYGEAETVLGRVIAEVGPFEVITKLPPLRQTGSRQSVCTQLSNSFHNSLLRLNCKNVSALLIHNCEDLLGDHGEYIYELLCSWKKDGVVGKIGVSVYETMQITEIVKKFQFDIIQVPVSILDQRLFIDGTLNALKNSGVEVHARSVFLQGLLLMDEKKLSVSLSSKIAASLKAFHGKVIKEGVSPLVAALGFVKQNLLLDHIVIGIHSRQQFEECINAFNQNDTSINYTDLACLDPEVIDPRRWVN